MEFSFEMIREKEDSYQLNTYKKFPISIERGEGVNVFDSEGKRYLDLYGGHSVALTGHCHPAIVKAVKDQIEKLIFYSNVVYSSVRAKASEALIDISPPGIDRVFFCNSGAEANETALKIARKFSGKKKIIAMKDGFHGRTLNALSATGLGNYRRQFAPILDYYVFVEFGSIEDLEKMLSEDIGAIILEPIQSMAGVEMADDHYYKELRDICSKRGIILIFDEVQTGFGRTGSWFFGDRLGVVPDIITLAKGIGGGIPVGAVLINNKISKTIRHGEHGSTFGGGPVASRAVLATIDVIRDENLVQNAWDVGEFIKEELKGVSKVKEVKGRGLLLGVEIDRDASQLQNFLLDRGIITGASAKKNVIRLLPPLVLTIDDARKFIEEMRAF